jgi:hypothetical protein
VLLGLALKQIVALTTPIGFAAYAMPWVGTCGGTLFWDGLIAAYGKTVFSSTFCTREARVKSSLFGQERLGTNRRKPQKQDRFLSPLRCILLQAQIRGFGVYTSVETFNEIMEEFERRRGAEGGGLSISEEGKVQIARAIGVGIVSENGPPPPPLRRSTLKMITLSRQAQDKQ